MISEVTTLVHTQVTQQETAPSHCGLVKIIVITIMKREVDVWLEWVLTLVLLIMPTGAQYSVARGIMFVLFVHLSIRGWYSRGYMFCPSLSVLPTMHQSVCPCVCVSETIRFMFPRYLQYLLMDFHQTFVIGASWDKDELIRFWGQRSRSHFCGRGVQHDPAVEWSCLVPVIIITITSCISTCPPDGFSQLCGPLSAVFIALCAGILSAIMSL